MFPQDLALLLINLFSVVNNDTKGAIVLISIILWLLIVAMVAGCVLFVAYKLKLIKL